MTEKKIETRTPTIDREALIHLRHRIEQRTERNDECREAMEGISEPMNLRIAINDLVDVMDCERMDEDAINDALEAARTIYRVYLGGV